MNGEDSFINNIWPIGGGKGGSGKTFLTGSLGLLLARQGLRTLLIDADLGAANLHTVIGVAHPGRSLSDFVNKKVETLEDAVTKTPVPNLYFISGAGDNLDMANLVHTQKMRLLRAISKLPYEHILLDLGAGTSFNTIDFFLISNTGIFITTPEPTSIENVYRLIRSVYLRKIRQVLREEAFRELLQEAVMRSNGSSAKNPEDLLRILKDCDPVQGGLLEESLRDFRFKLVLNQLRKQDNHQIGTLICRICEKHLGLRVHFLGNILHDDRVHDAVCRKVSFLEKYPYTQTATDLREFCHRFLTDREENPPVGPSIEKTKAEILMTANC
ncbi:MAG: AAA family ATPase [Deltaproteobacteria bacterium]|nr:AAA family ATPase [Deltaproteobacteria bacterium]